MSRLLWFHSAIFLGIFGCSPAPLVVYCSVDEGFARDIFARYEQSTGRRVEVIFDSEAGKTTGLVRRIRAEASSPRASVFWSGELINTLALAEEGLLAAYDPSPAADIPPIYRDPQHRWTAMAIRSRVLAYDPTRVTASDLPERWQQLGEERFAQKLAFANPLFGTTRGHVAAMFALWGETAGREYLANLAKHQALMVDGNSAAVRKVIAGEALWAMTDSDDVLVARMDGASLEMKFLDMGDGGTLLMPCSVALIAGAPRADEARKLIDFLISAEVEELLFKSSSGNYPTRPELREKVGCTLPPASKLNYQAIAAQLEVSSRAVQELLIR